MERIRLTSRGWTMLVSTGPFPATSKALEGANGSRCKISDLQQCIQYFEDRPGQLFDVHTTHIRADIKMHSTAQQVERSRAHIPSISDVPIMPPPRPAVLGPSAFLHDRRPMRIDVVIYTTGFVDYQCTDSLRIESRRNSDSAFRTGRKKDKRYGRIAVRIVYRSEGDPLAPCHVLHCA